MDRIVTILAVASMAFAIATPAFSQGRYGDEAKQRARDREERAVIRRAEHPELYEKAADKPAAPAEEAAAPVQPAPEPAPEPVPAPAAPAAAQ